MQRKDIKDGRTYIKEGRKEGPKEGYQIRKDTDVKGRNKEGLKGRKDGRKEERNIKEGRTKEIK